LSWKGQVRGLIALLAVLPSAASGRG